VKAKSRIKKSLMRRIIRGNKDIGRHPEWWDNKDDEFYSPFINEIAAMGIYPSTWDLGVEGIKNFYGDFIYTYQNKSGKFCSNIASISFSDNTGDIKGNRLDFHDYSIYMRDFNDSLEYKITSKLDDISTFKSAVSDIASMLKDRHAAHVLFVGSNNLRYSREMNSWNMFFMVMESYWDYARGGVTHMYKMKGDFNKDNFDVNDMFDKFEISSEELQYQKDEYEQMYSRISTAAGKGYAREVEKRIEKSKEKSSEEVLSDEKK